MVVMAYAASPEIVEGIRHGFRCWNRRDLPEMMEAYAPDAELDFSGLLIDEGVHRGREAIIGFYDRLWEVWSGISWEPDEVIDAGDGDLVVVVRIGTTGRGSGIQTGDRFAVVYRLGEQGITHAVAYPSRTQALEAVMAHSEIVRAADARVGPPRAVG
jgi:ketosteroid isomerase-like protein